MAQIRIGCSGFLYDHWRGTFYPEDLPRKLWLGYYSKRFSTVELNVTFYRLPERETFAKWYTSTPDGFIFSLKGSRFITHVKKLKDCAEPIEAFFSRASVLKEKLGVILWQLPPNFNPDLERLKEFLEALRPFGMRNTFEFRNKNWVTKKVFSILEKENAALCMADHPDFLRKLPVTADFIYIRRHGEEGSYATSYSTESLKEDAKFVRSHLRKKTDVFLYFNNDARGYAPKNAAEIISLFEKKKKKK
jgi:uncharacterized protein YecE (DUF72 family)